MRYRNDLRDGFSEWMRGESTEITMQPPVPALRPASVPARGRQG